MSLLERCPQFRGLLRERGSTAYLFYVCLVREVSFSSCLISATMCMYENNAEQGSKLCLKDLIVCFCSPKMR